MPRSCARLVRVVDPRRSSLTAGCRLRHLDHRRDARRTGFLPQEDQGAFFVQVQLPQGASLVAHPRGGGAGRGRSCRQIPAIENVLADRRLQPDRRGAQSNCRLHRRAAEALRGPHRRPQDTVFAAIGRVVRRRRQRCAPRTVFAFNLPPIIGLGTGGGFEYQLQDLEGRDAGGDSAAPCWAWSSRPTRTRGCTQVFSTFSADHAVALPRRRPRQGAGARRADQRHLLRAAGLARRLLRQRLQPVRPHLAGEHPGRGAATATTSPTSGASTSATAAARWCRCARSPTSRIVVGPQTISRYNNSAPSPINGAPAAGRVLRRRAGGDGGAVRAACCRAGYGFEWTGTAYQEKAGGGADHLRPGAWRCCSPTCSWSALYESWTIPVPVLLSVAVGGLGSFVAIRLAGLSARRLCADRAGGADRAGRQERHPDHRIRQGAARARHADPRGRDRRARGCGSAR